MRRRLLFAELVAFGLISFGCSLLSDAVGFIVGGVLLAVWLAVWERSE